MQVRGRLRAQNKSNRVGCAARVMPAALDHFVKPGRRRAIFSATTFRFIHRNRDAACAACQLRDGVDLVEVLTLINRNPRGVAKVRTEQRTAVGLRVLMRRVKDPDAGNWRARPRAAVLTHCRCGNAARATRRREALHNRAEQLALAAFALSPDAGALLVSTCLNGRPQQRRRQRQTLLPRRGKRAPAAVVRRRQVREPRRQVRASRRGTAPPERCGWRGRWT